ncbi:MAG TPA: hypothetical protein VFW98_06350 [Gemmatimonadaceae bacterium]|nr:hypothetical protein [Gemmatimonadaceae bacterium]
MIRPILSLSALCFIVGACATSPRASNAPPPAPTPTRRGDTTTTRDTVTRDTSAARNIQQPSARLAAAWLTPGER